MFYKRKTDKELFELAEAIIRGEIFCSTMIRETEKSHAHMIFLPLLLSSKEQIEQMKKARITFFFEEYKKALPRGINGFPLFMSVQYLNDEDQNRLAEIHEKITKSQKSLREQLLEDLEEKSG